MNRGVIATFVTGLMSLVLLLLTSPALAQPHISSLSKTTAPNSGLVLIHGTNFGSQEAGSQVWIDGIASIITTWTDTELHAYVPELAGPGSTTVTVETAGGTSNAVMLDVTLRQPEGRFLWRFEMDFRSSGAWTAVAPDGTIYCSDPFRLYALTPAGGLKWVVQDAGGERPISVGADGTIYTATNLAAGEVEGVIALNPDGSTLWTFIPETSGNSGVDLLAGPSLGPDGNIYAASNINVGGPGTFSLGPNGNLRWTSPDPGSNGITNYEILFDIDQVYVTLWGQGGGPEIMTYDLDGDLLWTTGDLGLAIGSAPEIDPFGRLIMQWALIGVQVVDRDGAVQWIYDPPGSLGNVVGPTVGSDGVIYSGTWGGGDLFAINPDGTTKWLVENQVEGFLWHMVVTPDNSTLVDGGAPDFGQPSTIRGFDTANGSQLWSQDFHFEEGLNEFAAWIEPSFNNDGTTMYVNTEFSGDTKPANLYAVDVTVNQGGGSTAPYASKFLDGQAASGLLPDVFESDDLYWELDPVPTTNPVKQKIDLILLSESPVASPTSIQFRLEAAMIGGPSGDVIQTLELWDETNRLWDVVDARPATVTDGIVEVTATGDLARFVHPLNDEIIAKVKWESPSFSSATFNWSIDLDQAVWLID